MLLLEQSTITGHFLQICEVAKSKVKWPSIIWLTVCRGIWLSKNNILFIDSRIEIMSIIDKDKFSSWFGIGESPLSNREACNSNVNLLLTLLLFWDWSLVRVKYSLCLFRYFFFIIFFYSVECHILFYHTVYLFFNLFCICTFYIFKFRSNWI